MTDLEEKVVALVQCRTREPDRREELRAAVASTLRVAHGLDVTVVLTPPHSLPQTSSGKLSRSRAKSLYLSGAFTDAVQTAPA
jgi:fatty-acyl-CoA synthase